MSDDDFEYDDTDFRIDPSLPEFTDAQVEDLREDRQVSLWPLAIEHPDEGDILSEIQPSRSRRHRRWEEVESIPVAPMKVGDTFTTRVADPDGRTTLGTHEYRVLGRMPGMDHDWLVVEALGARLTLGGERSKRPQTGMRVRLAGEPGSRRPIAEVGDSRFALHADGREVRHVARPEPGGSSRRHGYSHDDLTRTLVDAHMLADLPLPDLEAARREEVRRWRQRLRPYEWTLKDDRGRVLASGTCEATSPAEALDFASYRGFGYRPEPAPVQEKHRWVWTNRDPVRVLEVRQLPRRRGSER